MSMTEQIRTLCQMEFAPGRRILWIETSNADFCDRLIGLPQGTTWGERHPDVENYWSISDSVDPRYTLTAATIQFLIQSDLSPFQDATNDPMMTRQILILQGFITPTDNNLECQVDRLSW
ncbi:hypothetical protein ACQ4M3_37340 [Leptolyngbya sp. AN03gr2]|uniref:hypothetical protein n=1 Tax=unclassified Leptolyngbya TaxID=2650499 RepID=UPI003D31873E